MKSHPRDNHAHVSPYVHWDCHVGIDMMKVPQSWLQIIANAAGLVLFMVFVVTVVMHG